MVTLEWLRQRDRVWLPPDAAVSCGKVVILRGWGYDDVSSIPSGFRVFRLSSKLARWAMSKFQSQTRWEIGSRPVIKKGTIPFISGDSDGIALAPAGVFHMHHWQFTDDGRYWSPVIRTARVTTIRMWLKGDLKVGHAGMQADVTAAVDPSVRIDLSLPWDSPTERHSPRAVLEGELEDLKLVGELPSPSVVLEPIERFLPPQRPEGVEIEWEPQQLGLDEGEQATVVARFLSLGETPFAFCFVGSNEEGEIVACSEVSVIWQDPTSGAVSLAFSEG